MEKGRIEFEDPNFRAHHDTACTCSKCSIHVVRPTITGVLADDFGYVIKTPPPIRMTPNATILAHLRDLRELLDAGDVESGIQWIDSAVKLLEKE